MKRTSALLLVTLTAATALGNGPAQTNDEVPLPSCDRIDYSHPAVYLPLNAHIGSKDHILKVAAKIRGRTPEEKLVSIYHWIDSNLVYKADAPNEWRDFDGLLRGGNYGGCADYSVVFGALARACGIPTVWVKTLDADWIREFRTRGKEGNWSGHVFLEIFLHDRWVLLDDTQLVLYEDYDPKMRILPGNRYAYGKGGDPYDLILSNRWELCKAQIRAFCRDFDLSKLPVGKGRDLAHGTQVGAEVTTAPPKYPAVFVFYSEKTDQSASILFETLYPKLTHHLTGRHHSVGDYQEQFTKWTKPGDTLILLLLADEKDLVPEEFQDLLPKSWPEIEAEVNRKRAVRFDGQRRSMHVVLLVAKTPAELAGLARKSQW
ncbi:MAG: transglutaminase-like domain-containing protein [Thermoguttaceae bacterium]